MTYMSTYQAKDTVRDFTGLHFYSGDFYRYGSSADELLKAIAVLCEVVRELQQDVDELRRRDPVQD